MIYYENPYFKPQNKGFQGNNFSRTASCVNETPKKTLSYAKPRRLNHHV
jgi:hypothetical protein